MVISRTGEPNLIAYIQARSTDGTYTIRITSVSSPLIPRVESIFPFRLNVGQQVFVARLNNRKGDFWILGPAGIGALLDDVKTTTFIVFDYLGDLAQNARVLVTDLLGYVVFDGTTNKLGQAVAPILPGQYVWEGSLIGQIGLGSGSLPQSTVIIELELDLCLTDIQGVTPSIVVENVLKPVRGIITGMALTLSAFRGGVTKSGVVFTVTNLDGGFSGGGVTGPEGRIDLHISGEDLFDDDGVESKYRIEIDAPPYSPGGPRVVRVDSPVTLFAGYNGSYSV